MIEKKQTRIEIAYNNFIEEAEMFFVKKFISTGKIEKEYSECLDIIFNITGKMDNARGLIAQNPRYGQGKSFLFDVANHRSRRTKGKHAYKRTTARELCDIYTSTKKGSDPIEELNKFLNVKNLFIDDIGDELKDGKERSNYSNRLNVIRYVLLRRYDQWMEKGFKLYGTTNLTIKQISENYDGRIADRLQQMTYFKTFSFLEKGSFRQMKETRKLNQQEVRANWEKLKTKPIQEEVDTEKYFNELMLENDEYFEQSDSSFWSFVKKYLIKKEYLTEKDFDSIDASMLDASRLLFRREVRNDKRSRLKHATSIVRSSLVERALNEITAQQVYEIARNTIAKRKFLELRKAKHVFK